MKTSQISFAVEKAVKRTKARKKNKEIKKVRNKERDKEQLLDPEHSFCHKIETD